MDRTTARTGTRAAAIGLAVALAVALSACGDDDAADPAPTTAAATGGDTDATTPTTAAGEAATGEPILIGFINSEGGAFSVPEMRVGSEVGRGATSTTQLGGAGGRPLQFERCATDGSPEASIDCANQLVEAGVVAVHRGRRPRRRRHPADPHRRRDPGRRPRAVRRRRHVRRELVLLRHRRPRLRRRRPVVLQRRAAPRRSRGSSPTTPTSRYFTDSVLAAHRRSRWASTTRPIYYDPANPNCAVLAATAVSEQPDVSGAIAATDGQCQELIGALRDAGYQGDILAASCVGLARRHSATRPSASHTDADHWPFAAAELGARRPSRPTSRCTPPPWRPPARTTSWHGNAVISFADMVNLRPHPRHHRRRGQRRRRSPPRCGRRRTSTLRRPDDHLRPHRPARQLRLPRRRCCSSRSRTTARSSPSPTTSSTSPPSPGAEWTSTCCSSSSGSARARPSPAWRWRSSPPTGARASSTSPRARWPCGRCSSTTSCDGPVTSSCPIGRVDLGDEVGAWPALVARRRVGGGAGAGGSTRSCSGRCGRRRRWAGWWRRSASPSSSRPSSSCASARRGGRCRTCCRPTPSGSGSITVRQDRFWLAGIAVAVAVALWAYGRFTRLGLATRAAAQDERGAVLLGCSPDRLAAVDLGARHRRRPAPSPSSWRRRSGSTPVSVDAPRRARAGLRARRPARRRSASPAPPASPSARSSRRSPCSRRGRGGPTGRRSAWRSRCRFVVIVVALFLGRSAAPRAREHRRRPAPCRLDRPRARPAAGRRPRGRRRRRRAADERQLPLRRHHVDDRRPHRAVARGADRVRRPDLAGAGGVRRRGRVRPVEDRHRRPVPVLDAAGRRAVACRARRRSWPSRRCASAACSSPSSPWPPASPSSSFVFRNPKLSPTIGNLIPDPSLFGIDLGVRRRDRHRPLAVRPARAGRARASRRWPSPTSARSAHRAGAAGGALERAGGGGRSASTSPRAKLLAFALSSFLAGLGGALLGYSRGQLSADSFTVVAGLSAARLRLPRRHHQRRRRARRRCPRPARHRLRRARPQPSTSATTTCWCPACCSSPPRCSTRAASPVAVTVADGRTARPSPTPRTRSLTMCRSTSARPIAC